MSMLALHGINKDALPGLAPQDKYTDGRNIYFKAGKSVRSPGYDIYADTGRICDVDWLQYVEIGPLRYWLYASAGAGDIGVAVTDGEFHFNLTPAGWAPIIADGFVLTGGTINNIPFINHPEVGPFYWAYDTAAPVEELIGWPDNWTARVMRSHKDFLMAINVQTDVGQLESQVSWSNSAEAGSIPVEWIPTPENDAGDATFAQSPGPLLDGLSIRDQFFVAKRNFCGVMQYIGGQFVFQVRDVFPTTGLFATGAWVEDGNMVYMLTGEGKFIRTDGTSQQDLVDGVNAAYLRDAINYQHPESVFCYHDQAASQVVLCYPTGVNQWCDEGLSIEVTSLDCGFRDLPDVRIVSIGNIGVLGTSWDSDHDSWDSDTTSWDQGASGYQPPNLLFGCGEHGMLSQGSGPQHIVNHVWADIRSFVTRQGIDFTAYAGRATISALYPRIEGNPGTVLTYQVGCQDHDNAPLNMLPVQEFTIGTDEKLDFFIDGKLIYLSQFSIGGAQWAQTGLQPVGRQSGRW
jgi:hypothetical protein